MFLSHVVLSRLPHTGDDWTSAGWLLLMSTGWNGSDICSSVELELQLSHPNAYSGCQWFPRGWWAFHCSKEVSPSTWILGRVNLLWQCRHLASRAGQSRLTCVVNTGEYCGLVGPGESHVMLDLDTDPSRSTGHHWRPANVGSAQWNLLQSSSCCLQVRSLKTP